MFYIAFGIITSTTQSILKMVASYSTDEKLLKATNITTWVFRAFPPYSLYDSCILIGQNTNSSFDPLETQVWSENSTAGWTVVDQALGFTGDLFYNNICMLICAVLYSLLVCAIEYGLFSKIAALCFSPNEEAVVPSEEDTDVKRERERVDALVADAAAAAAAAAAEGRSTSKVDDDKEESDRLIVSNIQKEYAPPFGQCFSAGKKAVRGVSFAVPVKECFGMLGHNGT